MYASLSVDLFMYPLSNCTVHKRITYKARESIDLLPLYKPCNIGDKSWVVSILCIYVCPYSSCILCIVSANINDVKLFSIPALGIFHKYTNDSAITLRPSSGLQLNLQRTEKVKFARLNCNLDEGHSIVAEILV